MTASVSKLPSAIPFAMGSYLVERVEKLGNQGGAGRWCSEGVAETEVVEVADEAVGRRAAESQGVAPEVPLEDDDTEGHHDHPDERQGRLSAGETGVEEGDAGDHEQHHGRRNEDVGLVAGLVPLVEVLGGCRESPSVFRAAGPRWVGPWGALRLATHQSHHQSPRWCH